LSNLITATYGVGATRLRAGIAAALVGILFFVLVGDYYTQDHHGLGDRSHEAVGALRLRTQFAEKLIANAALVPGILMTEQPAPIPSAQVEESVISAFQSHAALSKLKVSPAGQPAISFNRLEPYSIAHSASQLSGSTRSGGYLKLRGRPIFSLEGDALVVTQPIESQHGDGPPIFWGDAKASLSVAALAEVLQFDALRELGYALRLDYFSSDAAAGKALISIGGELRDQSISNVIGLPQGSRLTLHASLPANWNPSAISITELILLFAGAVLLSMVTFHLLRRSIEMDERVALRTLQLEMDKELLESELDYRTHAVRQLQESHTLLDSIFENMPSMIVLKRVSDLSVVRVNRFGESILGQSRKSLIGRFGSELFPGEQGERDAATDRMAMDGEKIVELPAQFIQTNGGVACWIKIKKLTILDGSGKPSHILEIGEDITAHKHLDAALTEQLSFVEQLLGAIPSPIFFKDTNGTYMGVNKAFEEFYGTTSAAIVGKTVYDISPPELAEVYDKADRSLLESGGTQTYEARVKCANGIEKDVVFFKAIFSTTRSEVGGIVGVILDVTQQKAAERHILRQNRTLAVVSEANQAILRAKDCHTLIRASVDILHNVGGFPLAWLYAYSDDLPDFVANGLHPGLAETMTDGLRAVSASDTFRQDPDEGTNCRFYASLRDCGLGPDAIPPDFESHGFAHLPLWVDGRIAGGICLIGLSEDLVDMEERTLLARLAENISHAIDALLQERARQVAERKLELASHVFENSAEGVMITDEANNILMVNRRFSEITGYSAEDVTGKSPKILNSGQQDRSFYNNMWRALTNRGEWHGEIRNRRKDGEIVVEWMNISAVRNTKGEIINYVAVFSEITVHKTIKKRMQFLAHYDALTSLPNRILFNDRLEQSIIAARQSKRSTALMLIDLDHFDLINQSAGHSVGDLLLQEVSSRLRGAVALGNCVARLGGDEFAIALSDIGSNDEAAAVANRLLKEFVRVFYVQNTEQHLSASIGISVFPRDGNDVEALTKSADAAMYLAAEAGGNTFRFPQANERLSERIKNREQLQRAIERDELKVFYQPLISGETGRIVGAEALLRWCSPEFGYVSPESFVPMLEDAGFAVKVGDWALRSALESNMRWRKEVAADLFVAVNFCTEQVADEKAVEKIEASMRALKFDPRHLHLEISESTLMQDAPAGLALLHRLKDLGIGLTMDNVGTGYSSLSYLNRFPIDCLKIDRTFVQDTPNDAEAVTITRTIIEMGHALQLKIIAAGVETDGQVNFLRQRGCDVLQGYRFSQGVSEDEFLALLAENSESWLPEAIV
jgi:diguanylate cyclase (GGDEF)-like protein/PAS domain S-box-containing protein